MRAEREGSEGGSEGGSAAGDGTFLDARAPARNAGTQRGSSLLRGFDGERPVLLHTRVQPSPARPFEVNGSETGVVCRTAFCVDSWLGWDDERAPEGRPPTTRARRGRDDGHPNSPGAERGCSDVEDLL